MRKVETQTSVKCRPLQPAVSSDCLSNFQSRTAPTSGLPSRRTAFSSSRQNSHLSRTTASPNYLSDFQNKTIPCPPLAFPCKPVRFPYKQKAGHRLSKKKRQPAACAALNRYSIRSRPEATQRPLFLSNSRTWLPVTSTDALSPSVNRALPNTTPVSRKSSTRTLTVDSMPVGIAP